MRATEQTTTGLSTAGRWTGGAVLVALLAAASGPAGGDEPVTPPDRVPFEKQFRIDEDPERPSWQMPDRVLSALGVAEGQTVVDVGSGTGFFTRRFSPLLGKSGQIYAVEIDTRHLDYLENRIREDGLENIVPVLATPTDPKVPGGCCDLAFLCNTYHLISDRVEYLRTLAEALKPNGRLAIIDWRPDSVRQGALEHRKVPPEIARRELSEAGFRIIEEPDFLPHQYFLIASPSR